MLSPTRSDAALGYVRSRPEIWEVIFPGGDPLVLSARRLSEIIRRIAGDRAREDHPLPPRLPVVAPGKITPSLIRAWKAPGKTTYVALHAIIRAS